MSTDFVRKIQGMRANFEEVSTGAIIERLCKEALAARALKAFIEHKVRGKNEGATIRRRPVRR